jgi:hypothetical protein
MSTFGRTSPQKRQGDGSVQMLTASGSSRRRAWFPYVVAIVVLIARALTSGPAYYVDGPRHLNAIADHVYAIQPPGYWLFTRLASLFAVPSAGIH